MIKTTHLALLLGRGSVTDTTVDCSSATLAVVLDRSNATKRSIYGFNIDVQHIHWAQFVHIR